MAILAATTALFAAALTPAWSSDDERDVSGLAVVLVPADPLPGENIAVYVKAECASQLVLSGTGGRHEQLSVSAGSLSALDFLGAGKEPRHITGAELSGDLACIRWQLPKHPGRAELTVSTCGITQTLTIDTTNAPGGHRYNIPAVLRQSMNRPAQRPVR